METYIIIGTHQGLGGEKAMADYLDSPSESEDDKFEKSLEALGGKLLHGWTTLGRFDFFAVVEVPNADTVRACVACLSSTTETLRAFPDSPADESTFRENAKKVMAARK